MTLLDRLLAPGALTTLFQPIVEVQPNGRSLFAFEALTRGPARTNIERSEVLFEYVRRKGREAQVDLLAIGTAMARAHSLPVLPALCLNVHAATLDKESRLPLWLAELAREHKIRGDQLVVEIIEHAPPWSGRQFLENLDKLRELGVRIALDDVGLGQSSFRMMLDCRPDLLKIDRHFAAGAHGDAHRRAVLESISGLAQKIGARAVAEGIEDEQDLEAARAAGISLVQGFLFCRPSTAAQLRKLRFPDALAAAPAALTAPGGKVVTGSRRRARQ